MVENDGLSDVIVKITGMAESETLTGTTGQYSFTGLRAGAYTVEISGFDDEDVGFGATSSTADLEVGESQVVTFEGTYLRASSIMGQVSIEGTGLADVTVSLQGKGETREMPTNGAGQYLFEDLRRGDYAIGISGFDDDEYGFDVTSKSIHVPYGETENVPFEGIALRTAEIRGTVAVDGMGPLEGVTVSLVGKGEDPDPVVTRGDGQFSFDRLHAGDYRISIFGYDTDEYGFDVTSQNVTVALKETAALEFDGIMLRTAAIEGMVTIKGDGLGGVTVTVAGGPKDEEHEATTNSAGMYDVGDLHAGDYSVTITGYDTREYGFEVTTKSVSVGLRETADVAFAGILLRTAGVSGRVTVDGEPMSGWTVALSGEEDRAGVKTNSDGQYGFSGLAAGDYKLTLSGYDTDEYAFEAEMEIELELDEATIANFEGRSLRTVVVMGTVSAEGDGIMRVGVTLTKVLSANSGEILGATITDEDGGYMFDELLAGIYRIDLGETDEELDFATKNRMGSVATDDTATWNFDAEIIRTASVGGTVTVDGDGMGDVTVMLTGDHGTDEEMETGSNGSYMFDGLRRGDYTVSIENPDDGAYDFPTTSRVVNLAVGQTQEDISFAGSMLRRASISGQVHVEGDGLEGVTVTLDGDAEDEATTDDNGEYNFPGLAGGDYEVSIENPDADAYIFGVMEIDVDDLGDEEAAIVDFAGEHTATASVSGVLFADEVKNDSLHTDGEPGLELAKFPLILQGPGLDDATLGETDSTGAYSFDGLKAGKYNLVINMTDALKAILARNGYEFTGEQLNVVDVPAATDVDIDVPFRITKQTIVAGALLANKVSASFPVNGVRMALYPTAEDAEDGTNSLGAATTRTIDGNPGLAQFEFDREDDEGPGGGDIDYLVFAKVLSTPTDLVAHDDANIEIEYEAVDRVSHAPTVAKLINTRVNFQWWVKSDETAKDGNEFLRGWSGDIKVGTTTVDSVESGADGRGRYTGTVTEARMDDLIDGKPVTFTVALDTAQADSVDMNEKWTQSSSLSHVHTGLENPLTNTMANNDLGPVYITWTTQSLVLGVYREADDVEGFTNYQSGLPGGDHRPVASVAGDMEIKLMARDSRNRLKPYKYDHDACTNKNHRKTEDREAAFTITNGLTRVSCLPANDEFTISFDVGDDRVEVGAAAELSGYVEAFNDDDLSLSGSTVGTFGAGYGGVPEVRICLSSDESLLQEDATSDEWCATWAYQWTNGELSGLFMVKTEDDSTYKAATIAERLNLDLEAITEEHGAEGDTTSGNRNYGFDELLDGTYVVSVEGTKRYRVDNGPDTVHVFYDENAGSASDQARNVEITDLDPPPPPPSGLHIMGYIGNDTNNDKKFRGDEAAEGVTVRLSGHGQSKSTTTDADGFYEFRNVPEGDSYTVTPTSTGTDKINRGYTSKTKKFTTNATGVAADEYPSFKEGDHGLPYWSYASKAARNTSVTVSGGGKSAALINFVRLFADGQVDGGVTNLSGGAGGIDLIFEDDLTGIEKKLATPADGEFSESDLLEGATYTAYIEDAGWAIPCMKGSKPDDDGPKSADGSCSTPAPSTIEGYFEGRGEADDMGTLWIYDESLSDNDRVSSPKVSARQHGYGSAYDSAVSWPAGLTYVTGTETTSNSASIGTISWKSASVRFTLSAPTDGSVEITDGTCTGTTSVTCTLPYNRTGSTSAGTVKADKIAFMSMAANGYDDHEYSFVVSRAAPVGNDLANTDIIVVDTAGKDTDVTADGDGDGESFATRWTLLTESGSVNSADVRFGLETLGSTDKGNAVCAQSIEVREYRSTSAVRPETAKEGDICTGARYNLDADEIYELHVDSEDGVTEVYYLEVDQPGKGTDDRLKSLEVDDVAVSLNHPGNNTDTTFHSVVKVPEQVTVEWETFDSKASVTVSPRDADSGQDGHQFDVGDPNDQDTLTIRVVAEDRADTAHYGLVVRRANDVATLATLSVTSPTDVDLNPDFAEETTAYTADVAEDVASVTLDCGLTDTDGSTNPTCPHAATLGAAGSTTTVSITVTAEDGSTTETYTVAVTRAPEPTAGMVLEDSDDNPYPGEIEEGATDTIFAELATQPSTDSTVTVSVTATGLSVSGSSTLTFTSTDWNTAQEVIVVAADDDDAEPNDGEIRFAMSGDSGTGYFELTDTVEVAIAETDTKGVNLSATAKEVDEAVAGTYTVVLNSQPVDGNVNIEISGAPSGVTVAPAQLAFTNGNWETPQDVTITPTNDTDTASYSAFDVSHAVLGGGYTGMDVEDVTVQILDDEAAQVVITTTGVTMDEGGTFTYNIALTQAPSSGETVTVDLAFNTGDFSASATSAELTSSNFNTGVAITITARNVTADATKSIGHNVSVADTDDSDDQVYADGDPASSITVTVKNVPDGS